MPEREVFLFAPLRLVSLEIRFPLTSRVLNRTLWDALERTLGQDLPLARVEVKSPDTHIPVEPYEALLRRLSEGKKRAITLYSGALTVELADYRDYDDLRRLTAKAVAAFDEQSSRFPCTRLGLRYINEIESKHVHGTTEKWAKVESWRPYINRNLLNRIEDSPEGLCPLANRGSIFFHSTEGDEFVTLDYAIHPESVIDPDDVLTLEGGAGPCFVLDIDASQSGSSKSPVAASGQELLETLDRLHSAVEATFDWSVTEQLKEVFRGRSPEPNNDAPIHRAVSA